MGDYPDRAQKKKEIKLRIDHQLKEKTIQLAEDFGLSKSGTIECVIFMIKCEYETANGDAPLDKLRAYKARRFLNSPSLAEYPPEDTWHLTLDSDALEFCFMLRRKYPMVFDSVSMVICLCLAHAIEVYDKSSLGRDFILTRLKDELKLHPVRKIGSRPSQSAL